MVEKFSDSEILDPILEKFIGSIDEILGIFESLGSKVTLHDNFSKLLMHVQPGFMQHLRSCQILAANKLFFSLGMICRSLFDLEIMLCWIDQLDVGQKNKAIQTYLDFNGTHPETKKRIQEWQKIVDPAFTYRKAALDLKIDAILPLIEGGEDISFFDFLSKILHWNPQVMKDIIGRNRQGIVTYKPGTLSMITLNIALKSICGFTLFYALKFFPNQQDIYSNTSNTLTDIKNRFQDHISQHLNSLP